jgi:hypothetical protein
MALLLRPSLHGAASPSLNRYRHLRRLAGVWGRIVIVIGTHLPLARPRRGGCPVGAVFLYATKNHFCPFNEGY